MYASSYNSVHHMPKETDSLLSSSFSTTSNSHSINVTSDRHIVPSNGSLYTDNMAHGTSVHKRCLIPLGHLLMEELTGFYPKLKSF